MGALLTTFQNLLLTYRFNGGTLEDAASAFRMARTEVRVLEAEAMRTLRAAGYDAAAVRDHYTDRGYPAV